MDNITDFFVSIISQSNNIEIAASEFRRAMADDENLRREYRIYCRENGVAERRGFLDFCEAYLEEQNGVWDSLNNYDDIE